MPNGIKGRENFVEDIEKRKRDGHRAPVMCWAIHRLIILGNFKDSKKK